jgi:hypothetical protein
MEVATLCDGAGPRLRINGAVIDKFTEGLTNAQT